MRVHVRTVPYLNAAGGPPSSSLWTGVIARDRKTEREEIQQENQDKGRMKESTSSTVTNVYDFLQGKGVACYVHSSKDYTEILRRTKNVD